MRQLKEYTQYKQSLFLVRKGLIVLSVCVFFVQLYIDQSLANVYCNILCLCTFIPACAIIFQPSNGKMSKAIIGSAVFFIIAANSIAPMLGTIMEGNSLVYTLLQPKITFLNRTIFALILLVAHLLASSSLFKKTRFNLSKLGGKLGIRLFLSVKAVWILGLIGLSTFLLKQLPLPSFLNKFFDAFGFLGWAPFMLLLNPYWSVLRNKNTKWLLLLYYLIQISIALANNSRMGIIGPVAMFGVAWTASLLLGLTFVNNKLLFRGLILLAIGLIFSGLLLDLSTALLIERGMRSERSTGEQISATLNRFSDKESLISYRKIIRGLEDNSNAADEWHENYIRNDFIGRFVQIKYDDNCFHRMGQFNEADYSELKEKTNEKIIALAPDPLLKLFKIKLDKDSVNAYSIGDLFESIAGKGELGSFRVGSIPAHAYGLYGWYYPAILLFLYTIVFVLFNGVLSSFGEEAAKYWNISTFVYLIAVQVFNNISLDGITSLSGLLLRGFWQIILIYFISLRVVKLLGVAKNHSSRLKKTSPLINLAQ